MVFIQNWKFSDRDKLLYTDTSYAAAVSPGNFYYNNILFNEFI